MAQSSILASKILWMEEPDGLQSMGSPRAGHDSVHARACAHAHTHTHARALTHTRAHTHARAHTHTHNIAGLFVIKV